MIILLLCIEKYVVSVLSSNDTVFQLRDNMSESSNIIIAAKINLCVIRIIVKIHIVFVEN